MILIDFIGEGNTSGIIHNESIAKIESYTAIINIIKSVPKDNPEIPEKVSQVCKLPGVKDNDLKKFLNISKGLIDVQNYELLNKLLELFKSRYRKRNSSLYRCNIPKN